MPSIGGNGDVLTVENSDCFNELGGIHNKCIAVPSFCLVGAKKLPPNIELYIYIESCGEYSEEVETWLVPEMVAFGLLRGN